MYYTPEVVQELVHALAAPAHQQIGSAAACLYQWDYPRALRGDTAGSLTATFDSAGICVSRAQYFSDRGQGVGDAGQYGKKSSPIFGASGALAAYRITALQDIAYVHAYGAAEYFDENLHYKNDIDLAYRLQWAGWGSMYVPSAVAYHARQADRRTRSTLPLAARVDSYRGQRIVIAKNFSREFSLRTRIITALAQYARTLYYLLCEPRVLFAQKKLPPETYAKVQAMPRRVSPQHIESLMV